MATLHQWKEELILTLWTNTFTSIDDFNLKYLILFSNLDFILRITEALYLLYFSLLQRRINFLYL